MVDVTNQGKCPTREEMLRAKMRASSLAIHDLPIDGYVYKGYCVLPGSDKYFASETEVDELLKIAVTGKDSCSA